ncbi:phytanoyl-CoA dioxygenase family protein, partial [Cyanobacteria bacterium 150SLHA]
MLVSKNITDFSSQGVAIVRNALPVTLISKLNSLIVNASNNTSVSTDYSDTYNKAFSNGTDLAYKCNELQDFVSCSSISNMANEILGCKTNYFRDQFFVKKEGTMHTPFHQDAHSLPYYCKECLAIWIPFHKIISGPLVYKTKTHISREPYISPEYLDWVDFNELSTMGLSAGDISIHHGWTIHGSKNLKIPKFSTRMAWSIMYVSQDEYALKKEHEYDKVIDTIDSNFLSRVKRIRNEIKNRKY